VIYYDDRRAKSDILPVNSSTKSVCGMEESYEEKSFLSVKNKIIFALLPIVVIVCIFVCVLTVKQMNRELKDNIDMVSSSSQELQNAVADVRSGLNGISDMVASIEGIASQTNLLSLNASIEAARAGDAKGRFCRFGYGSYDTAADRIG